jgi:hypothetical protein
LERPAVRILIVLSDGESTRFDSETYATVLQTARRAGVAIYPVLVANGMRPVAPPPSPPPPPRTKSKKKGEPVPVNETADVEMRRMQRLQHAVGGGASIAGYRRLAESGGQLLTVLPTGNSLPGLFAEIAKTLRYSYVASYRPSKGTRDVKVELVDKTRGNVIGGVRTVVR